MSAAAAPRPVLHKRLTLVACIIGSGVVFLDATVVNVALPAIRSDLGGGLASQQWVVEAYLLTLGSLLLVGGALGDLLGRRRVFAAGVAGFGVTSLLCAVAPSDELLIGARAVQGVAGALLVPSTLALIMDTFEEDERGAAIGSWTAWTGIGTVVGPLGGGFLVDAASWRWIFALNVIPVLLTLWLLRYAPVSGRRLGTRVDVPGAVLGALGLAGPVFALIEQQRHGWSDPVVLGPLLGGVVLLAAFFAWERRSPEPMLPLSLFRSRNFAVGNAATLLIYAALGAFFFFAVVFLQQVADYSAFEAGLALMPVTVLLFVLSKRAGALADRYGPRLFMGVGPIVAGGGLLLALRLDARGDYISDVLPAVSVFALGLAITVAPLTAAVLSAVEPGHSGLASGTNNAVARIAGLLAIAVVGAVVAGSFGSELDERLPAARLSQPAAAAAERAKDRPLVTTVRGVPAAERPRVREALTGASVDAFRVGIGLSAALTLAGGLISLIGIENPRRKVAAEECPGGAICGASEDAAQAPPSPGREPTPARA